MSLKDKEARAVYNQEYHAKHREKILAQQQIYRKNNLLSLQKKEKQYAEQHREQCLVQKRRAYQQNPEKFKQRVVVYQKRAPDKMREMRRRVKRKYRKKHPGQRVISSLSSRMRKALGDRPKVTNTLQLLGCTPGQFKTHLQFLFQPGMRWENYGRGDGYWSIDHIRPCASYDLLNPTQQKACFHYTNLQPLWWRDNSAKGAKWTEKV